MTRRLTTPSLSSLSLAACVLVEPPRPQPQPVAGAPIDLEALAGMVVGQLQPQLNALQAAIPAATNASLQAFQAQLLGQLQQVIGGQQPQQDGVSTLFQVDLFP